jgi:hypothetical protein
VLIDKNGSQGQARAHRRAGAYTRDLSLELRLQAERNELNRQELKKLAEEYR